MRGMSSNMVVLFANLVDEKICLDLQVPSTKPIFC